MGNNGLLPVSICAAARAVGQLVDTGALHVCAAAGCCSDTASNSIKPTVAVMPAIGWCHTACKVATYEIGAGG
jgi:hypothetical protein